MVDERIVHIVDDDNAIRRSASFLLRTSGYAARCWQSGTAFLKDVGRAEPGCILLDIRMPEKDGIEVQAELVERGVTMPVIILTGHGDISIAVRAMRAGAIDFLEKPFQKAMLIDAIDRAFEQMAAAETRIIRAADANTRLGALTPREREVLEGLAQGLPNKSIAYDMGISPRTVEVHRANLMSKLGVHSLSDALRIAFAAGMGE